MCKLYFHVLSNSRKLKAQELLKVVLQKLNGPFFLQKLSDEEHFVEGEEHNPDYDHEAFLGDEAKEFDELSPEESKERLA